jgi:hypothetical protein
MAGKVTLIGTDTLAVIVAAAKAAVEDLDSGLADGTYEDDELGGFMGDTVRDAIKDAEEVLR